MGKLYNQLDPTLPYKHRDKIRQEIDYKTEQTTKLHHYINKFKIIIFPLRYSIDYIRINQRDNLYIK